MVLTLAPVGLDGEHRARLGALAVDVDGARAAVARVAPDVGAGQPERVAEEVDEQEPRLDVGLVRLAVDGDGDVLGGHRRLLLRVREGALGGRAEGPDGHLGGHRPLVFDGPADVADRAALRPGGRAGRAEELLRRGVAARIGLGVGRRERGLGDARDADAGARDRAVRRRARRTAATPTVAKSPTLRSSFV